MLFLSSGNRRSTGSPADIPLFLTQGLIARQVEFRLSGTVGQRKRATAISGLLTESEVDHRRGNHLLPDQQTRANLNFSADGERIHLLVDMHTAPSPIDRRGPENLPVIVFLPLINALDRLALFREGQQIEAAVPGQVHGGEDIFRKRFSLRCELAA